jgi:hypothetical protein
MATNKSGNSLLRQSGGQLHCRRTPHHNARDEWELTERGQEWAEAMPYCRHGYSGYQILWNPAVVDVVRELG